MEPTADRKANAAFPANYSRRSFLSMIASLSAGALMTGCAGGSKSMGSIAVATPSSALPNPQPQPQGNSLNVLLSIEPTSIGEIPAGFAGLSYEKATMTSRLLSAENAVLVNLFRLLGQGVLRIGGNSVDTHVWVADGAGKTAGQIAPSDVYALAGFVKATGWKCIYGVNLGGAGNGTTSPELAAAEVAYAAAQFGSNLLGIEIGNECEGYGAAGSYFAGNWSLEQFISLWLEFRQAIVSSTPGVAIAGPASGTSVAQWTAPFAQAVTGQNVSLITQHYYRGDGRATSATVADLVSPDTNLPNCLANLQACSARTAVPFRIAECNSYYNGGAMNVSDTYASTLWSLDFLFSCAQGGSTGVNLHGGGHAPGYTPIADSAGTVTEIRPEYYGLLMFCLAGTGTLVKASLSGANATAYAVRSASGNLNVVIVNKDTQNLQITLELPQNASTASLLCLTQSSSGAAPDLQATTGVTIQRSSVGLDGSFTPESAYSLPVSGRQTVCYVPAQSAVLIKTM